MESAGSLGQRRTQRRRSNGWALSSLLSCVVGASVFFVLPRIVAVSNHGLDGIDTCFALAWHKTTTRPRIARPAKGWQQWLDKAMMGIDEDPASRLDNLRKAFEDPRAIVQDLTKAAKTVAEKGFAEGHVEAMDTLVPKGTVARSDLDGFRALRSQFPEIVEELQARDLQLEFQKVTNLPAMDVETITSGLVDLAVDTDRRKKFVEGAKNAVRSLPRDFEKPFYTILRNVPMTGRNSGEIEIRSYAPLTVARTAEHGLSFSSGTTAKLSDYFAGKNFEAISMPTTTLVEMCYAASDDPSKLSFALPAAFADNPPVPDEVGIELVQLPERLVAVKKFPGVDTNGEVRRQRELLLDTLWTEGIELADPTSQKYSVLQYNPPYTVPWRRLNEVAVLVAEGERSRQTSAGVVAEKERYRQTSAGGERTQEGRPRAGRKNSKSAVRRLDDYLDLSSDSLADLDYM